MNSKTAKLLRKVVRSNVVRAEARDETGGHKVPERAYTQNNRSGTVIVAPGTFRGMYRQLKKAYKAGKIKFTAMNRAHHVPA